MKAAAFPVTKTLDSFDVSVSSVPQATLDYLTSLEWIRNKANLCLVGPAGTGKSHLLVALGHTAVDAGHRVRYFTAAELVETLYRALADNSVGKTITNILRADLILIDEIGFAPMDTTGAELFFRLVAAAYERRSLGIGSHWPFEQWGKFLPRPHHRRQPPRPTPPPRHHRHHRRRVPPHAPSTPKHATPPNALEHHHRTEERGLFMAKSKD